MMNQMMLVVVLLATVDIALSSRSPCQLPRLKGKCAGSFKRYYFNYKKFKCVKFVYGGCGGNANNFQTKEECMKTCYPFFLAEKHPCGLPRVRGNCQARIIRYYFNQEKFKCKKFIYGGCDGNANNFKTKKECMSTCYPFLLKTLGHPCTLPKVIGPCKANKPRWYYNGKNCEKFRYGGCKGNGNNFKTEERCTATCSKVKI